MNDTYIVSNQSSKEPSGEIVIALNKLYQNLGVLSETADQLISHLRGIIRPADSSQKVNVPLMDTNTDNEKSDVLKMIGESIYRTDEIMQKLQYILKNQQVS